MSHDSQTKEDKEIWQDKFSKFVNGYKRSLWLIICMNKYGNGQYSTKVGYSCKIKLLKL